MLRPESIYSSSVVMLQNKRQTYSNVQIFFFSFFPQGLFGLQHVFQVNVEGELS